MKNTFLLTVPVILMLLPWLSVSFAQHYIPGYLPEGAIARFGKGYPFNFQYSSDGTKLAVASTIGIWLYDTRAGGEELDLLTGHTHYVSRVIFSPDNQTLASICRWEDYTVRLWDGVTGAPKAILVGHTGEINTIVFSPDGKTLASASGNIRLWDGVTGESKATLTDHRGSVKVLAFSPDSSRLASGGTDEVIRLWDVATGELLLTFAAHANAVDALMYSPDGEKIASQGLDGNVCLWNAQTGEFLHLLSDWTKEIASIDFSKDGETLATAYYDGTIQMLPISLWETERGLVNSIDFSYDGKWIVIANSDSIIKVLDVQSGKCVTEIENQNAYGGLACSSNGRWIATAATKGIVKVIDIHSGIIIAQMDRGEHKWQSNDISQLQFSPDGKFLAARAGHPKLYSNEDDNYDQLLNPDTEGDQIYVWDPETGEAMIKFAGYVFAFSQDSCLLAGAASDETVEDTERVDRCVSVWDITSKERIAHFTGHSDWVDAIAFSPCGQFVASSDRTLRVWDIATGSQKQAYPDLYDPFYTKDAELFAFRFRRSTNTTEVWNAENQEKILEMSNGIGGIDFAKSLAIAYTEEQSQQLNQKRASKQADGSVPVYAVLHEHRFPWPDPKGIWVDKETLASKTEGPGILLWDVKKKGMRDNSFKDIWFGSYTVLPSGRILASGIYEDSQVWDASKPDNPIAEFTAPKGPSEWARHAVFSPIGDRIAAGSRKGTLYVWNFEQPEHPIQLTGHTEHTWALAFSPDGKRLVSGAADYTARIWDVELGEEIAILPMAERRIPMGFAFSPYSLDAESEPTIEIIDLPIVLNSQSKRDLQNRVGNETPPDKNSNNGLSTGTETVENNLTQDAMQWNLPEDAKARLGKGVIREMQYSPDGKLLAVASGIGVWLYDVTTYREAALLTEHTRTVDCLAFSPDGHTFASGDVDGTIILSGPIVQLDRSAGAQKILVGHTCSAIAY